MVHLGVQHPFGQGFLQIVEQAIRIESRLGVGAGQQLVEKGIRNTRFFASRYGRAPLLPSCPTPHEIPDSPLVRENETARAGVTVRIFEAQLWRRRDDRRGIARRRQ
jgi:hypothetical protein